MSEPIPVTDRSLSAIRAPRVSDDTRRNLNDSRAANTKRAYQSDLRDFAEWCGINRVRHFPAAPESIADYISRLSRAGAKPSTIERRIAAISSAHKAAGVESPTKTELVRKTMQGIRRNRGTRPTKKRAVSLDELRAMCLALPDTLRGQRDRAILTLHFAGAFRRSEVAALTTADLDWSAGEFTVTLRKSKSDQEGRGTQKIIAMARDEEVCPMRSLRAWLGAARITDGALFRMVDRNGLVRDEALSDWSIAQIWKRAAGRVGLKADDISGHTPRRGFITAAYQAELPESDIMAHTGHRSMKVMRDYRADSGAASRKVVRAVLGR